MLGTDENRKITRGCTNRRGCGRGRELTRSSSKQIQQPGLPPATRFHAAALPILHRHCKVLGHRGSTKPAREEQTEPGEAARGWHSSDQSAVSAAPSPATHGVSPACPIPVLSSQEASDGCWHPWAMAIEALLATRGCPAPGRCPELIRSHSRTEVRWRAQHSSPHTASFKFPEEAAEV